MNFSAVYCVFDWDTKAKRNKWKLTEVAFCVDGYVNDERPIEWIAQQTSDPKGRAVTLWTLQWGVELVGFSEPTKCSWLQPFLCDPLQKSKWWEFIEDGFSMIRQTADAVYQKIKEGAK